MHWLRWSIRAVASCAAEHAAYRDGDLLLPYRVSGIERQADAAARGLWHPVETIRGGDFGPRPGDVAILKRGDEAWQRHVCRVIEWDPGGGYTSIGGNEGNAWRLTARHVDAPELLGIIRIGG